MTHSTADVQTTFSQNCQPDRETEQLRRVACTRQPAADQGIPHWPGLLCKRHALTLRTLEEMVIADLMIAVDERIHRQEDYTLPAEEQDDPLASYPDKPC